MTDTSRPLEIEGEGKNSPMRKCSPVLHPATPQSPRTLSPGSSSIMPLLAALVCVCRCKGTDTRRRCHSLSLQEGSSLFCLPLTAPQVSFATLFSTAATPLLAAFRGRGQG
jgi:hypothetical protein